MGMFVWLRKAFIRDYDQLDDPRVRSAHGALSSWIGIFLNAILVGLKLSSSLLLANANHWVFSMALLGDALNNFFDFSSSIISLIGFRLAKKPADKKHPYGHGRSEYVAGMLIGVAIVISAALLFYRSLQGAISHETVHYDLFAFLALALTLPLKGFQSLLNASFGKALSSPTLKAVARDALIDVTLSTTLLIGFLLSRYLGFPSLDGYLGMAVSLFLCYAGIKAFKEAVDPILGTPLSSSLRKEVEAIVLSHPHVHGVHDFLCHSYGEAVRFLSFHVELDDSLSLREAHEILDDIEEEVSKATHSSVIAHPDPIDVGDPALDGYRKQLHDILDPHSLSFHDLHLKDGMLHFEILIPFGFPLHELEEVKHRFCSMGIPVNITFDHPYEE